MLDERAVEAIKDGEFGFVDLRAFADAASDHLYQKMRTFPGRRKTIKSQCRDAYAGRERVYVRGHDKLRIRVVQIGLPMILCTKEWPCLNTARCERAGLHRRCMARH
jgi:hypothetical protein